MMIRKVLHHPTYQVCTINSDTLPQQLDDQPDLIIIDISPHDPKQLQYIITRLTNDLGQKHYFLPPVLALTDFNTSKRQHALETGLYDLCYFPIIEEELSLRLRQACLTIDKKK
ncbi:hypothetical protein [Shewanella surugensis]|uniref:Response regulator n=1 Tax=Shewanella surugensis TaxID=212020 RepID=A0ABT0L693_9GAMM|nr:hypothetical protein [Shewanella surugensis]MCL1123185.1 hypothetical protein [Shewanella surugensis]